MEKPKSYLYFASRTEWRAWLKQHHRQEKEAWLIHYKKGAKPGVLTYEEAVEEALCFGWIDSLLRSRDAETFVLRYSPRRPNSTWSTNNIRRVETLTCDGRMTSAGLELVNAAKENGEWAAALQREKEETMPPDLERALRQHSGALRKFKMLTASQKKQYFWWISSAKREATRTKRIQAIVDRVTYGEQG